MTELTKNPEILWGAKAIGACIGKSQRATFHMLEEGKLPCKKLGKQWVATRRQLLDALAATSNGERS
jgi:hypothetical protein